MITSTQAMNLQRTLRGLTRGNGETGPLADALTCIYAIACELTDAGDIYQAAEDLVDAAMRARDEADNDIINAQALAAANRADDRRLEALS